MLTSKLKVGLLYLYAVWMVVFWLNHRIGFIILCIAVPLVTASWLLSIYLDKIYSNSATQIPAEQFHENEESIITTDDTSMLPSDTFYMTNIFHKSDLSD